MTRLPCPFCIDRGCQMCEFRGYVEEIEPATLLPGVFFLAAAAVLTLAFAWVMQR